MSSSFELQEQKNKNFQTKTNLECFLDFTTPRVRAQALPKSSIRDILCQKLWQVTEKESVEFFTLEDLWDTYDEWSAYGAGVPIIVNPAKETVVQYYVPYLSALQIYTTKSYANMRMHREDVDTSDSENRETSLDLWSDDGENDKLSASMSNSSDRSESPWDEVSEDSSPDHESSSSSWHLRDRDRLGYLSFEYFERSAPFSRVPLMDKISEFAKSYPELMSLRSIDLSPASWMSVAWYPIYHIPTGGTIKDLSACFLTYHTLSPFFQENENSGCGKGDSTVKTKETHDVALPPFGLATYKMSGNLFSSPDGMDQQRLISLLSAADSWLKQLGVSHHDFDFFVRHSI